MASGDEAVGRVPLNRLEYEGPRVGDDSRLHERVPDLRRGVSVVDLQDDLVEIGLVDRLGQAGAEVAAHEVGHERQLERRRILGSPIDDRLDDCRASEGVQGAEHDAAQDQRKDGETQH